MTEELLSEWLSSYLPRSNEIEVEVEIDSSRTVLLLAIVIPNVIPTATSLLEARLTKLSFSSHKIDCGSVCVAFPLCGVKAKKVPVFIFHFISGRKGSCTAEIWCRSAVKKGVHPFSGVG